MPEHHPSRDPSVLLVVPARGGSKGLPRKNLLPLGGEPLVLRCLRTLLSLDIHADVVVSSEDTEILTLCSNLDGSHHLHRRPHHLAADDTPSFDVLADALQAIEAETGKRYDYVGIVQATTPLATTDDFDGAIRLLLAHHEAESVVTVAPMGSMEPRKFKVFDGEYLCPAVADEPELVRRQDLPETYCRNGALYLSRREVIDSGRLLGSRVLGYVMPKDRSYDINDETDFDVCAALLTRGGARLRFPDTFDISGRTVGTGQPAFVVVEIAQSHDGSLDAAHEYIELAAAAGADAVKFQTHIAEAESTPAEPFRVAMTGPDANRQDYWRRTGFDEAQWKELAGHAERVGLTFLSSPFSIEAVELLTRVGVAAWKIPSGEVTNTPLIERVIESGLPVLLSTGMSTLAELDRAVSILRGRRVPLVLLQCTSMYPTPPHRVGLNMLEVFRARFGAPVGLSDHSGTIHAGLAAVAHGACVLEVHIKRNDHTTGPDAAASLSPEAMTALVEGVRYLDKVNLHPVDKDAVAAELGDMRRIFTKSVVARRAMPAGEVVSVEDLAIKKPGTGLSADRLADVVGRRLARDVRPDELLTVEDFT